MKKISDLPIRVLKISCSELQRNQLSNLSLTEKILYNEIEGIVICHEPWMKREIYSLPRKNFKFLCLEYNFSPNKKLMNMCQVWSDQCWKHIQITRTMGQTYVCASVAKDFRRLLIAMLKLVNPGILQNIWNKDYIVQS